MDYSLRKQFALRGIPLLNVVETYNTFLPHLIRESLWSPERVISLEVWYKNSIVRKNSTKYKLRITETNCNLNETGKFLSKKNTVGLPG